MRRLLLALTLLAACGPEEPAKKPASAHDDAAPAATNRIAIPPAVRRNLGITFATVERRPVRGTLRVPGEFELRPEARREYRLMLEGRVELAVRQFQAVAAGDLLVRLDSPGWRRIQHEAAEAQGAIVVAQEALAVAEATRTETEHAIEFLDQRMGRLREADVRRVDLEAEHAQFTNRRPRLAAQVRAAEVRLIEAREHYASQLRALASVTGLSTESLLAEVDGEPKWRALDRIELRAEAAGIVDRVAVTNGGWVETGGLVLSTADPTALRFHARAPQGDAGRIHDGLTAQVVPPQGGSVALDDVVAGKLRVGFLGQADARTLPLYLEPTATVAWAKPGVTAYLEVFVEGGDEPELALPRSCIVREGLGSVFFRREPDQPDEVRRVEADLGTSDGRWVVVYSGVEEGDEVVLDGAYALTLAGGARKAPEGYHYHADGSLHKDGDD